MPIDSFPNIGNKLDRFGAASSVPIFQVVGLCFLIQNRKGIGKQILSKSLQIFWEDFSANPENDKTNMPKDDFL